MNKKINLIYWPVVIIIPFFLIMTSVRLLVNPIFAEIEYRMPGFPDDSYGFTKTERLHWARYAINYLLNSEEISYLGDLKFDNGNSLYNERELKHMLDVKILVQTTFNVWWIMLAVFFILGIWSWRKSKEALTDFFLALRRGGILTLALILFILLSVAISFQDLFTQFHHIFFSGDTWLFYFSDTLIRLFPLRFWQDAFILMGIFSILEAIILIVLGNRYRRLSR